MSGSTRTEEETLRIIEASIEGTRAAVFQSAVTLIDRDNGMSPSSGTAIQIGGRLLVATAAHCIPSNPNGRLWLVTKEADSEDGFPKFERSSRSAEPGVDVGVLELHPAAVRKLLPDLRFASLDDIAILGTGDPHAGVVAVGSPSEHASVRKTRQANIRLYLGGIASYWTIPLGLDEWPTMQGVETAEEKRDIFLPYPYLDQSKVKCEVDGITVPLPKAPGMSGGGVWDQKMEKGEIWSASDPKLFGIVSSWSETGEYLRAIQIVHWLRLVAETFPELADEIYARHPRARIE